MSGAVNGGISQDSVLEVGNVPSGLLVDLPLLPILPDNGLVSEVPQPVVSTGHGANRVIITRVNKDLEAVTTVDELVVERSHINVHVLLRVPEGAAATSPFDISRCVDGLLNIIPVKVVEQVVLSAGLVVLNR